MHVHASCCRVDYMTAAAVVVMVVVVMVVGARGLGSSSGDGRLEYRRAGLILEFRRDISVVHLPPRTIILGPFTRNVLLSFSLFFLPEPGTFDENISSRIFHCATREICHNDRCRVLRSIRKDLILFHWVFCLVFFFKLIYLHFLSPLLVTFSFHPR